MATTTSRIPTLDGWRGVAILGVLFSHARMESYPEGEAFAFRAGSLGVSLFFAISGFLITTLLLDEEQRNGLVSLRSFYQRRAFRILPAAFFFLLIIGVAGYFHYLPLKRGEILASAFFFSNYWPNKSWYTAHFWSLSIEEHFYLIWPLILAKVSSRRAVYFAAFGAAAVLVWRPFGSELHHTDPMHFTDMRLDAFLCAALVAIVYHRRPEVWLFRWRWTAPVSAVFVAATIIVGRGVASIAMSTAKQSIEAMLLPVIIAAVLSGPRRSLFFRLLDSPALGWIGGVSYSLYLWQEFFISPAFPFHIALQLIVLVIAAWLSLHLIENPCRRMARGVILRKTPSPASSVLA